MQLSRDDMFQLDQVDEYTIEDLRLIIDKADALYYRLQEKTIVSDEEYDLIKSRLKQLDPTDERLTRVGIPRIENDIRTKVKHTIPMGSLDNLEDGILGFDKWYAAIQDNSETSTPTILASLKIDGSSIRARYENGRLVMVATRGNGEIGEDITANGINFRGLPLQLSENITCDVRGEAILYIKEFKDIVEREFGRPIDEIDPSEISNPRNVGNGILGRDNGVDSDRIQFLAFKIVSDNDYETETARFKHMRDLGFETVPHFVSSNPQAIIDFFNKAEASRNTLKFEIDGVVVVADDSAVQNVMVDSNDMKSLLRPKHSRAIKFQTKTATTVLTGVTITVGHTGAIIPTGIVKTVRIGGVNVSNVLLNNWDEIKRFDLAIGDNVTIGLAGDVIPKCLEASPGLSRVSIPEPGVCPSCGSRTSRELRGKTGAVLYCTSPSECPAAQIGKVDHWIGSSKKGIGILGIGDTTLQAFVDLGLVADPADLYTLTVDRIKDVVLSGGVRVGESRAQMIVDNIQAKRELPLHVFLGSLGIELLGKRRVQLLQSAAGGQLDSLDDWLNVEKLRSIQLDGFGDAIRDAVVAGIQANAGLIAKLLANGVVVKGGGKVMSKAEDSQAKSGSPFAGMSFCFTGTRDGVEDVERLGGTIKSGVSKGLTFLVQKDAMSQSNKTKKADEYGTKVISVDYLKRAIAGEISLG